MDHPDPRTYWNAYVERLGGAVAVSKHLDIPYSTVAAICNGWGGIGRNLALRMSERDPSLDPSVLVFVIPTKTKPSDSEAA